MSEETKRYIVTLNEHEQLDNFYEDMEGSSNREHIPTRQVECNIRKPVSRNTVYLLTDTEAKNLQQDSRVSYVMNYDLLSVAVCVPGTFKFLQPFSDSLNPTHQKWSFYRIAGKKNAKSLIDYNNSNTSNPKLATMFSHVDNLNATGKDVDVVIWDGHLDQTHPELKNAAGTSRFVRRNWYLDTPSVTGGPAGDYAYTRGNYYEDAHADAMTSHAVGLRNGWAPDANIYNIGASYAVGAPGNSSQYTAMDQGDVAQFIRLFHQNKANNPTYGNKNPTIVNASFAFFLLFDTGISNTVQTLTDDMSWTPPMAENQPGGIRGFLRARVLQTSPWNYFPDYTYWYDPTVNIYLKPPFNVGELRKVWKLGGYYRYYTAYTSNWSFIVPLWYPAWDADIQDMINSGVILNVATGNYNWWHASISDGGQWSEINDVIIGTPYGSSTGPYGWRANHGSHWPAGYSATYTTNSSMGNIANYFQISENKSSAPNYVNNLTNEDKLNSSSGRGPGTNVSAPGTNIRGSYVYGTVYPGSTGYYENLLTGTSSATAEVTGIAAAITQHSRTTANMSTFRAVIANNTASVNQLVDSSSPISITNTSSSRWIISGAGTRNNPITGYTYPQRFQAPISSADLPFTATATFQLTGSGVCHWQFRTYQEFSQDYLLVTYNGATQYYRNGFLPNPVGNSVNVYWPGWFYFNNGGTLQLQFVQNTTSFLTGDYYFVLADASIVYLYIDNYDTGLISGTPRNIISIPGVAKTVVNPNNLTASEIIREFGGNSNIALSNYYRGGAIVPSTASSTIPTSGAISYTNFLYASTDGGQEGIFELLTLNVAPAGYAGQSYTITATGNIPAPQNIILTLTNDYPGINIPTSLTIPAGSRIGTVTGTLPADSTTFDQTNVTIQASGSYNSGATILTTRSTSWPIYGTATIYLEILSSSYFTITGTGTQADPVIATAAGMPNSSTLALFQGRVRGSSGTMHIKLSATSMFYRYVYLYLESNGVNKAINSFDSRNTPYETTHAVLSGDIIRVYVQGGGGTGKIEFLYLT